MHICYVLFLESKWQRKEGCSQKDIKSSLENPSIPLTVAFESAIIKT